MELFDYLEMIYTNQDYELSLEDFIITWLDENFICNDSFYEEFINEEFVGEHTRDCKIDIDNRTIKLFINK